MVNEQAVSLDKNVVLVSNIFHDLTDLIQISTAENFSSKLTTENIFNNHLIVCIQKETLENITTFLERELKNV